MGNEPQKIAMFFGWGNGGCLSHRKRDLSTDGDGVI